MSQQSARFNHVPSNSGLSPKLSPDLEMELRMGLNKATSSGTPAHPDPDLLHSQISPRSSVLDPHLGSRDKKNIIKQQSKPKKHAISSIKINDKDNNINNNINIDSNIFSDCNPIIDHTKSNFTKMNNNINSLSISPSNGLTAQILVPSSSSSITDTNPIDAMEKEQEGIVMKLMNEIQFLKDENKILKSMLRANSNNSTPSSPNLSNSSSVAPYSFPTNFTSNNSTSSSSSSSFRNQRRSTITTIANQKRTPSLIPSNQSLITVVNHPNVRSRTGSLSTNWKFPNYLSGASSPSETFPFDNEYLPFNVQRYNNITPTMRRPSIGSITSGIGNGYESSATLHSRNISLDSNLEEAIEDDMFNNDTTNEVDDNETDSSYYSNYSNTNSSLNPTHRRTISDNTAYSVLQSPSMTLSLRDTKPKDQISTTEKLPTKVSSGLQIRRIS